MYHKAKKSLGQNFLKSSNILDKIVLSGEVNKTDTVLEIGPGKGALTEKLLKTAKIVVAIEKDEQLYAFLGEKFAEEIKKEQLILLNEDILDLDISKNHYFTSSYKIVANIPYNITGAIFKKFLTAKHKPEGMTLLVQYEVAKRIMARDGKESLLSISVKTYGTPSMPLKVPARYFSPMPKVDSAVIHIKNISNQFFEKNISNKEIKEARFWEIVHAGFAHKRKKLSGNLKNLKNKAVSDNADDVIAIKNNQSLLKKLEKLNLANARAEDLSLADWRSLVE